MSELNQVTVSISKDSQKAHHENTVLATGENQSTIIPACLPTPKPSSPNFLALFRADIVRTGRGEQYSQA